MTAPAASRLMGDQAQISVGASGSQSQIIGLQEWEINFSRAMGEATTTDDLGWETKLPSLGSWKATAKFAYVDQATSQQTEILAQVTGAASAQTINFFGTPLLGRDAWVGSGYIDSCKITAGLKKIIAMDVSIQGTGPLVRSAQLAPTGLQAES